MLRRPRAPAAPRPPLSSVWWAEPGGGVLPPLPASDPFGGYPAFPSEPVGGVIGGPPTPAPVRPPPEPPAAPASRRPSDSAATDEWLPLLTHEHQRFQIELEQYGPGPSPSGFEPSAPRATIDPMAAACLAGAFAADYLSWDETSPLRRGTVLAEYLPADQRGHVSATALRGWSGAGRQRADFALPGAVRPAAPGRVAVDVRVRITPYRAVGGTADSAALDPTKLERADGPAVAPAPTARGWKSLDSMWVRLTVPVTLDGDQLVVDIDDQVLSGPPDASAPDRAVEQTAGAPVDEPERRPPTPADLAAARAKRISSALTEGGQ